MPVNPCRTYEIPSVHADICSPSEYVHADMCSVWPQIVYIDFHSDNTCDPGDALKCVTVVVPMHCDVVFPQSDDRNDETDNTVDALKGVTGLYCIHAFSSWWCTRDVTVCRRSHSPDGQCSGQCSQLPLVFVRLLPFPPRKFLYKFVSSCTTSQRDTYFVPVASC